MWLVWYLTARSPDEANIKNKMLFAASKDALKRRLDGVAFEVQATDYSEVAKEASEWYAGCADGKSRSVSGVSKLDCRSCSRSRG